MKLERPRFYRTRSEAPSGAKCIDAFSRMARELFFIENPSAAKGRASEKSAATFLRQQRFKSVWVYYPWSNVAVRILPEELYTKVRTARNRNVISHEEQRRYRNIKAGVIGLSVGSGITSALALSGGPKVMKIADFDEVEVSNLNRIRARLADVGCNKVVVAAREIWDINPFAELHLWTNGVRRENAKRFIVGAPKLNVLVDEMDDIGLKIFVRRICRAARIPVVMATDSGDSVLLDIERFDLEPRRALFHGLLGKLGLDTTEHMSREQWLKLSTKIIGPEQLSENMQQSILEVGRTIAAVPQLGTTALMAGAAVSFAMRRMANRDKMPSGRYRISLEEKLVPGYLSLRNTAARAVRTKAFLRKIESSRQP